MKTLTELARELRSEAEVLSARFGLGASANRATEAADRLDAIEKAWREFKSPGNLHDQIAKLRAVIEGTD